MTTLLRAALGAGVALAIGLAPLAHADNAPVTSFSITLGGQTYHGKGGFCQSREIRDVGSRIDVSMDYLNNPAGGEVTQEFGNVSVNIMVGGITYQGAGGSTLTKTADGYQASGTAASHTGSPEPFTIEVTCS
jgi:hypothetical protein